ncbi:hypothetical protein D9Q98_006913 [Chlorella vulgaris]|uniref:peptidylprolyl isomerase n=1 Tax=Chlorella vulgaris TaxID=3077 RepID=A0A9D4TJ70_CHLVU|nr:hypothetical protein D9Q98_006913 [Chlorella vulgaris]
MADCAKPNEERSSQQHNAAACLSRDWRRQPRTATGCGYRCERSSSSRNSSNRPRIAAASQSTDAGLQQGGAEPVVASVGDVVTLKWKCFDGQGELLGSSDTNEEGPTTFEVGAGDIVGNRLFEAFDEAVRGMAVGDLTSMKAEGGEWKEELLFRVPRDHPEMERLAGRYKNQGGIQEGAVVELSNGGMALVVQADDEVVVLDANNMLAGNVLDFELELVDIERS